MARVHNFSAGPAALPLPVLERAQRELCDFGKTGMSILEHSHRGKAYDEVHRRANSRLRELLSIPDDYEVLFLQGGASLQFAMIPMNFVPDGGSADYVVTGAWAVKALAEAKRIGKARAAADDNNDGVYTRIPRDLELDDGAAYLHVTTNNTIFGTQFHELPETSAPLVADMSSDFLWKPFDVNRFAFIYAGAQKNVGPSGLVIVIAKKSLIASAREDVPNILRYSIHAAKDSLYNTPNTFGIYMVGCVLDHIAELGGLEAVEKMNRDKASLIYDLVDGAPDFFRCPVDEGSRSFMNIVFRLPTEELENKFVVEATQHELVGLKGHRSVGGIRVSLYNAITLRSVEALADFMKTFRARC